MGMLQRRMHNKEDKTYVILGAPHSATSFVAKALQDAGIEIGNDMSYLHQDSAFVYLNKEILAQAGGDWKNPPKEKDIMKVDFDKQIKLLIEKKKGKFWGWKDPSTSLTIKKYLPHLDGDVYFICCFRKPQKIVDSYGKKDKLITRKLIDRFNKSLISVVKEFCDLK